MTRGAKLLDRLGGGQLTAALPGDHVWLGASAGTGKTQVLAARVLRLLLGGVVPDAILCITFTKAGAAEMAHRIHERLALWVRMDDGDLRTELLALGVDWQTPGILGRARALFATVIDSAPGAIRVQTIHSFCQTLLASFPVEANILPGFRALDESEAAALQRQVLGDMLAQSGDDGEALRKIAAMLALRMGQDAAMHFLTRCAPVFAGTGQPRLAPKAGDVRAALGLPQGSADAWLIGELASGGLNPDVAAIKAAAAGWYTKKGTLHSRAEPALSATSAWLDSSPAKKAGLVEQLWVGVATKPKSDWQLRACFTNEKELGAVGDHAERIFARLGDIKATVSAMAVADDLAAAWDLGSRFAEDYALAKRAQGLADYDDLITIAGNLLATPGFGDWVRFKLDQRTDHILVDEAQDTNLRQWAIIFALADEFFAGAGAKEDRDRTMFAVGDAKQAIFGFQGTEPLAFAAAKQRFFALGDAGGNPVQDIELGKNFRSSPAILDIVDAWVATGGGEWMGLPSNAVQHVPHHMALPGRVELWRPLPVDKALVAAADDAADSDADGDEESGSSGDPSAPASDPASLLLSRAIADEVQDWIANGKDGRAVAPGDIMILVRKRRDLAARIVARLQSRGVRVAGVDRFALTQPLAVQDLLAALRFAVQPLDNLNLAALLVSPLFGWSQAALLDLAHGRGKQRLWERLRAERGEQAVAATAALGGLLAMADYTTPFRFLDYILSGPHDGRRRLYTRLGREARDPIDELLNQALAFEQQNIPSLLGFLSHIDASTADIKRPIEARSDVVRVMTVHGSKGLEAPIVILADATDDPVSRRAHFDVSLNGWDKLPVFSLSKDERHGKLAEAHADKERAEREEHWRLLYVAMTRAREMLVVTGITKKDDRSVPDGCWHEAVERVMIDMGAEWQDGGPRWGAKRVHAAHAKNWAKAKSRTEAKGAAAVSLTIPAWAQQPAPQEARPPRPLAPSSLGDDDVAAPPQGSGQSQAARRGVLLHALFERLPAVAADRRTDAASRWLAAQAPEYDAATCAAMVGEVLTVLNTAAYADVFGPASLAEVPLSAVVDGVVVAGIVDRLLVTDTVVTVIDYKTGRHVPASIAAVAPAYLRQMAAYAGALRVIFPGRKIAAALLYTAAPRLIALSDAILAAHKPGLDAAKANLLPNPDAPLEPTQHTP